MSSEPALFTTYRVYIRYRLTGADVMVLETHDEREARLALSKLNGLRPNRNLRLVKEEYVKAVTVLEERGPR